MTALLLWMAAFAYLLWVLYVFAMAVWRAWKDGQTHVAALLLASPLIIGALILDVLLNYTVFALATWDFPRRGEWTFSQRLNRLVGETTRRGAAARWLARTLLDPYDPTGQHIKQ